MQTSTTTGTGSFTLSGSVANYRTFDSVLSTGDTFWYSIVDNVNNAWECGLGTYSGSNVFARTALTESSTGSAINFAAGTKNVFIDVPAAGFFSANNYLSDPTQFGPQFNPGGRLTLASGTPVTTSDQTAKTAVLYTPYIHNVCPVIENSTRLVMAVFPETSYNLGTITSGKNYDVFAWSSGGVFSLYVEAWTNDTTRAVSLVNHTSFGFLVHSTNTYLRYLGTLRTTSTTTTEDSKAKRFLWNMYNRVPREIRNYESTSSWSYGTSTWRAINNSTTNQVAFVNGLNESPVSVRATSQVTSSAGNTALVGLNLDATTGAPPTPYIGQIGGGGYSFFAQSQTIDYSDYAGLGYHYLQMMEYGGGTNTFYGGPSGAGTISGTTIA